LYLGTSDPVFSLMDLQSALEVPSNQLLRLSSPV
jgi:hypothetical protein